MASVHSLTTAPVNVFSKTYWTGFIQAVNEEAAFELGMHDQINPEATRASKALGWRASLFTPNILRHTDVYVDQSTKFDFGSHTTTHVHHHHASLEPATEAGRKEKKRKEEEDNLEKYKWLGPIIATIGAFLAAYTWRGYQRCVATHSHTEQVKFALLHNLYEELTPLKPELVKIVSFKLLVDEIRYKILKRYFGACVGILVGGALLTVGAYTNQPKLIPWGQIALAVSAIWAAASTGLQWQDNKDIRKLYEVIALDPERLADNALWNLRYYQEGMILIPQYVQNQAYFAPPVYQQFFSQAQAYQAPPPRFNPGYNPNNAYPAPSAPYLYE